MGRKGVTLCDSCKKSGVCEDFTINKQLNDQGLSIEIVECEHFSD